MSMERKRLILGGLVLMLALFVPGRAWSQDPMIQQAPHMPAPGAAQAPAPGQTPAPAQTPAGGSSNSPDPMLVQPAHLPARTGGQNPEVSPAPTSTPPPRRDLSPAPKKPAREKVRHESAPALPAPPVSEAPLSAPPPPRDLTPMPKKAAPKAEKPKTVAPKMEKPKKEKALPPPATAPVMPSAPSAPSNPPALKKPAKSKVKKVVEKAPAKPSSKAVPAEPLPAAAPVVATPAPAADVAPVANSLPPAARKTVAPKKGKEVYSGPTEIVEMPPTPMLDDDGKQRYDLEGKPMFNPAVKQQRDKNGHPLFDASGKPVFQTPTNLGYDAKGRKIKVKKVKEPHTTSIEISKGTLTVDGLIGKAALNYQIKDFRYLYLYAPWIGTVVVSSQAFPGGVEQPKAFDQHTLTVTVDEHQFQLYSEKIILSKRQEPAFVSVDRQFKLDSKYPAMGYGKSLQAPYSWPGAKASPESKAYVKPPPVPPSLRQTVLFAACPDGQTRPASTNVGAPPEPCVAMAPKAVDPPVTAPAPATEAAPAAPETAPPPAAAATAAPAPPTMN